MSTDSNRTRIGACDTPTYDGEAETITPEGYICETCAGRLVAHYREERERDAAVWRDR